MENDTQKPEDETPKKPGKFNSLMLKILMLIIFALMMGMCSIKYMS